MPAQPALHEKAETFIAFLQRYRQDRGALANLRAALSDARRHRAWPLLGGFHGGAAIGDRRFELVAALWAGDADAAAPDHDLGVALRTLATEHNSFEGRLNRLLTADREEAPALVTPLVRAAQVKGAAVNYARLLSDLIYWGDKVRVRWARSFWGADFADAHDAVAPELLDATPEEVAS